jgi:hypothetical protein
MPTAAIQLIPGVNTQKTLADNQAGVSQSQVIRYRGGMIESLGGSTVYVPFTIGSTIRDLHAWQDAAAIKHLAVAATQSLSVITAGSNSDITPQTTITNNAPNISVSSGSNIVTIVDGGANATTFNTIYFNTPISVGGQILNGSYKISAVLSSSQYQIVANISSATVASSGTLPVFSTSSGSATVNVDLTANGFQQIIGLFYPFIAPTTITGVTISGNYQVSSITDSTRFQINSAVQSSGTGSGTMNGGNAQILYYVTNGPTPIGAGFGAGGFGSGGFGIGVATGSTPGTPITTTDWTTDNWGEILLACPKDGPIFTWSPDSGYKNAQVITQAPFKNGGIYVSMPQQILVAWRSVQSTGAQDSLTIRWCNALDFTNWTVSNQTTAGSFRIPTGSLIVGALQGPSQAFIWTDVDVWAQSWVGGTVFFNHTRIGGGCGLIGPHAAGVLGGVVYWCGQNNFFRISDGGVAPIPCTVWDFIFQNLNVSNQYKIKCATNASFNEIMWFFPSSASAGENDSYVKYNAIEQEWDYGSLSRTAWVDVSVLGQPIGSDSFGQIYQHETGDVTAGVSSPSFRTGWWSISEGNQLAYVDFVQPDFKWGPFSGPLDANLSLTFYAVDFPGDSARQYGPYSISQSTEYINPRIRGRLMSVLVSGQGFWRIGHIRYKWAPAGRR